MTDQKAILLALAKRCEREEPSENLNVSIFIACNPVWVDASNRDKKGRVYGKMMVYRDEPRDCLNSDSLAAYTTSLDAAVTLVPEGWAWLAQWIGFPFTEGAAQLWIPAARTKKLDTERVSADAKTPALALCAAALKARAAT